MSDEPQPEESTRAAAARARRQRILENSNKRLTKLTGREFNEDIPSLDTEANPNKPEPNGDDIQYPDPDFEREVFEAALPTQLTMPPQMMNMNDPFAFLQSMQQGGPGGGPNFLFGGASMNSQNRPPPTPETQFQRLVKSKLLIVFMASLTYLLFALHIDYTIGRSVFSILIAWEVFEFGYTTFIAPDNDQNAIITALFAFAGITQEKGRIILKLLGLTTKIVRDIAIFLFTFVLMHIVWCRFVLDQSFATILDKDFENILLKGELGQ